jgi:tRNA modification GTPase
LPRDRILFGHWTLPDAVIGATSGRREELVVCQLTSDRLEIHCHGGLAVVTQVLASLQHAGCTVMSSARWLLSQESDRLCAEARLALVQARTLRVAGILLDQSRGALSFAVQRIRQALGAGQSNSAALQLRALLAWSPLGLHLTQPWRIVIVGRANVGKSSLLNALLGYARALVHPSPGTTRDVLTAGTAVDGWPVEFADTAGTRVAAGDIELAGMQRAAQHATRADLILLVSDLSAPWTADDQHWLEWATDPPLVVHNKSDLVDGPPSARPDGVVTSARTAAGVPQLLEAIAARLVPCPPPVGTPVPFRLTHFRQLTRALQALATGRRELAIQALRAMQESCDE